MTGWSDSKYIAPLGFFLRSSPLASLSFIIDYVGSSASTSKHNECQPPDI